MPSNRSCGSCSRLVAPRIWDRAPYVVLVEEAGGQFQDLDGGRDPDGFGCMLTNGLLDEQIGVLLRR